MLFLVFGIAAAIGTISLTAYSLLGPFNVDDQESDEVYREAGDGGIC